MVCAKCQKSTQLATPAVKRKNEMYYGSPAGSGKGKTASASSSTLGSTGIGKSKLLGKSAKNPYASYSSSCDNCKVKVDQGKKYCHRCAYKQNACAMCGKSMSKDKATATSTVQGQRFSAK